MKKRVADFIFELLIKHGIDTCFSVVGGGAMHLNNAMALNDNIHKYFNHHEQACAIAAEAYARYSGKMAVVCVTSGPGATNAVTGVMGAWVDSIPMIVISGNVRYETSVPKSGLRLRYRGMQEFDIIHSVKNMTKYACLLTNPTLVKYELEKAIAIAMEGRPGPVWLDIPQDIQNAVINVENLLPYHHISHIPVMEKGKIQEALLLIKNASRPCILIGSGISCCHLEDMLEKFLETVHIPVVGGAWLGDVFYTENSLYYGLSGNVGPRTGNFILQNADVILVLGNSLSYKQTGYDIESFAPHAKIVMVDVDMAEYLKIQKKITLFIHGDLKQFLEVGGKCTDQIKASEEWLAYCNRVKDRFSPYEGAVAYTDDDRVNKYIFWEKFLNIMPEDTLLALGNSSVAMGINQIGRRFKKQRMISNYICGSMGYDLPAAIGVAVASNKEVVCVTGEGSFMMNMQELQTIRHYGLPIKIIIFENNGYGAIRQTCKNFFDGVEIGCTPETGVSFPSFQKIAETFGYQYSCCPSNDMIEEKLKWLQQIDDNAILEVKQMLEDPVLPKLMSHIDKNGNMTSPSLHDMFPFVAENEMKWLMPDVWRFS